MKLKIILLQIFIVGTITAQNTMEIPDITADAGDTIQVKVDINNSDTFVAFQCDIVFRNVVEIDDKTVTLTDRADGHSVSTSIQNDSTLRCLVFSTNQNEFEDTAGTVLRFNVILEDTSGTFPIKLQNPIISDDNSANILTNSIDGNLEIVQGAIPVELVSFQHKLIDNDVLLTWKTASETNNRGFRLERSTLNSNYKKIAFIQGKGNTTFPRDYQYIDQNFHNQTKTEYRLIQIDFDGAEKIAGVIEVNKKLSEDYKLYDNYPNPFNPSTKITYSLPKNENVRIVIYNTLGEQIRTFEFTNQQAGNHEITWNGENEKGGMVKSGVYIYQIQIEEWSAQRKMILIE